MIGVVLGLDRLGMVPYLAQCLVKEGAEKVHGLVNRPELLHSAAATIPALELNRVSNPFDPSLVAETVWRLCPKTERLRFLCVQDRLSFSYLNACRMLGIVDDNFSTNPYGGILRSRVKPLARARWNRNHVGTTRFAVFCEDDARTRHWQSIGGLEIGSSTRCIVKPVSGVGSEAVYAASGPEEVRERVTGVRAHLQQSREYLNSPHKVVEHDGQEIQIFSDVLVEEELRGAEFTVDGCIRNGEVSFVVQHKESRRVGRFFGDGLIVSPPDPEWTGRDFRWPGGYEVSPAFRSDRSAIEAFLKDGLRALGLDNWVFHCEIAETEDGLHFVELNPRGAGGLLWETAGRHLGIDPFAMSVKLCVGTEFQCDQPGVSSVVTGQVPIYAEELGNVEALEGVEEAQRLSGVERIQVVLDSQVPITDLDRENYLAYLHLAADNHEDVRSTALEAIKLLKPRYRARRRPYVRHDVGVARPYVRGGFKLLDFVQHVFGAVVLEQRAVGTSSTEIDIQIADSVFVLAVSDTPDTSKSSVSLRVYVEDTDSVYRHAREMGATLVALPQDTPNHERTAAVRDSFGNTWWISTYKGPER